MYFVEIVADRGGIVLLDHFYHDGAIRLLALLHDLISCAVALKVFLVLFHLLFY